MSEVKNITVKPEIKSENYLDYLNDISNTGGVTCLRGWPEGHHRRIFSRFRNDVDDLISHARSNRFNWFYTINDFTKLKGNHRYHASKKSVVGLRGVWLDIDLKAWIHKIVQYPRLNQEVKLLFYHEILPTLLELAKLPQPTAIDDSGYGFHVFWLFNRRISLHWNRGHLVPMWQNTVKGMLDRFNHVCTHLNDICSNRSLADINLPAVGDKDNSCNIAKLMRMPNTYNLKHGHKVCCHTVYQSKKTYSLVYLYNKYGQTETKNEYLAYRRKAQRKYNEKGRIFEKRNRRKYIENRKRWDKENARNRRRYKRYLNFKHHTKFIFLKTRYTLYVSRCKDILTLIHLRHGRMINKLNHKNCYELTVFLYAVNYAHLSHDKHLNYNLAKRLSAVNNMLNKPLSEYDLNKIIKEAGQTEFLGYGYPLNRGQHKKFDKAYLKNSWYIANLGITKAEMKSMLTLINKNEEQKRQKAREKDKQYKRKIKRQKHSKTSGAKFRRNKRNRKILKLHNSGLSERKIAKKLEISKRTVVTVCKRKKGGAIF